jgi:hypothetical protein
MEKQETPAPQQTDLASIIVEKDFEDAFNEFVTFAESVQGVDPAWESFLNYTPKDPTKDHLKIWRQLDKESGLYKWKVWGILRGVDTDAFHTFFNDLEFRKQWDSGTTNLQVIDALPEGSPAIIWWRFGLPLPLFNDRDFVFARHSKRFDHGAWVVWDKTVEHAKAPPVKNVVRVTNYHRYLVYRPHSEPQNMELMMCYVTPLDPGGQIPNFVINWATSTGCKSFLKKAKANYKKYPDYLKKKAASPRTPKGKEKEVKKDSTPRETPKDNNNNNNSDNAPTKE